jgi:hypothetical protein
MQRRRRRGASAPCASLSSSSSSSFTALPAGKMRWLPKFSRRCDNVDVAQLQGCQATWQCQEVQWHWLGWAAKWLGTDRQAAHQESVVEHSAAAAAAAVVVDPYATAVWLDDICMLPVHTCKHKLVQTHTPHAQIVACLHCVMHAHRGTKHSRAVLCRASCVLCTATHTCAGQRSSGDQQGPLPSHRLRPGTAAATAGAGSPLPERPPRPQTAALRWRTLPCGAAQESRRAAWSNAAPGWSTTVNGSRGAASAPLVCGIQAGRGR